jgi:hypothetical protein
MDTTDFRKCFANAGENSCEALSEKLCVTKGKCNFFKTREQFETDREKYDFINRIKKLEVEDV